MTYSELNINQKINFKSNAVSYSNAYGLNKIISVIEIMAIKHDMPIYTLAYRYPINYDRKK